MGGVVRGQNECFICHQRYVDADDRRVIERKDGELVVLNVACFEKVRSLATQNRVSLSAGLDLFSEMLAAAFLGKSK